MWAPAVWGYENRDRDEVDPPSDEALLWWGFARHNPDAVEEFLLENGRL